MSEYNSNLHRFNSRPANPGTFATSSQLKKPERGSRPYGGKQMSVARLKAYGPTRNYIAERTQDITG